MLVKSTPIFDVVRLCASMYLVAHRGAFMEKSYKRVNVMILEEQYDALTARELNVSGLIRDLLGDYLSRSTIILQVSDETRRVYDRIVSNTGASDADIEVHLRTALASVLKGKIEEMQSLHETLVAEQLQRDGDG
jgi:hypothetical protein